MILLSCKQTCGVNAITLHRDGYMISKRVSKIDKSLSLYDSYIEGFKRAFNFLRVELEKNKDDEVVIECNSSVFCNWLKNCETAKGFEIQFSDMWKELEKIPVKYSVVYKHTPLAARYAKESYIEKLEICSID